MSAYALDPAELDTMDQSYDLPQPLPEVEVDFAAALKQNLSLISIHKGEWSARLQAKDFNLEVRSDDQNMVQVNRENYTSPQRKLDWHPIFSKLKENTAAIDKERNLVCAKGPADGIYLIGNSNAPKLWARLLQLRDSRNAIVNEMRDLWDDTIVPGIRDRFPEEFKSFSRRLPKAEHLIEKYALRWDFIPITPIGANEFDLDSLTPEDRMRVIDESNQKLHEQTDKLVGNVMNDIFGKLLELCEEINDGSLETGKRREGALNEMLTALERAQNFGSFASTEVLVAASRAKARLTGTNVQQLNGDPSLQAAIKAAFEPLGEAIHALHQSAKPKAGRAARGLIV